MRFAVVYKGMCFGDMQAIQRLFSEMLGRGCHGAP